MPELRRLVPAYQFFDERNFNMRLTSRNLRLAVCLGSIGWMSWAVAAQAQDAKQPTGNQEVIVRAPKTTVQVDPLVGLLSVNHPAHGAVAPRCTSCHTPQKNFVSFDYFVHAGATHTLGLAAVPADATLRAQLALPAEKGLVVTNVDPNSSASEAGIAQHDLLLSFDDKPLASLNDLQKQVDAVGDSSGSVVVIRNGKPIKLAVTPKRVNRVLIQELTDSVFQAAKTTAFRIGVELAAAEETLRVQLKLPQGQGVVVTNVIDDLPAAKAGIQKHDILLMLSDKPVASHEEFRDKLQEVGEKPVAIKLLREGKPISIEVTPQKHQEAIKRWPLILGTEKPDGEESIALQFIRPALVEGDWLFAKPTQSADPDSRLQELIAQVKDLQKALESLSEDLKKPQAPPNPGEKK
jgi:serine protease Do